MIALTYSVLLRLIWYDRQYHIELYYSIGYFVKGTNPAVNLLPVLVVVAWDFHAFQLGRFKVFLVIQLNK